MALSDNDEGAMGCLIGVIVLVFAGVGFTIAADKIKQHRNRGVVTVTELNEMENQVISLSVKEGMLGRQFSEEQARRSVSQIMLQDLTEKSINAERKLKTLHQQAARLEDDVRKLEEDLEVETRRAVRSARARAMAVTRPILKLKNGKVYQDVRMMGIKADSIRIQHAEGSTQIPSALLDNALRLELGLTADE